MRALIGVIVLMAVPEVGLPVESEPKMFVFQSGNELLSQCQSDHSVDTNFCLGYVAGIADLVSALQFHGLIVKKICPPNDVTQGQIRLIALKYFRDHPESLHVSAQSMVLSSLHEAFPCGP